MKTLRWIGRAITALVLGLIGRWLYANLDFLAIYYSAYSTEILLGILALILFISGFCFLETILHRRMKLRESFEVFKPVEKLTPEDFHITNYDQFYIERESDEEIEDLFSQRKYVFIAGIPMLGKTRMAYEAAKKLEGFYLFKPLQKEIDIQKLRLPFFTRRIILFFDDLDKYVEKFNLDALVTRVKKKSKGFVVIATCRSGEEFHHVFAKKEIENLLTQCQKNKIEPRRLKRDEEEKLAAKVRKTLDQIASDGTPGSITIDLRYMSQRYRQLGDEKCILKCLKLLREGNIFLWTEDLVQRMSQSIFGLDIRTIRWDNYVKSLLTSGFAEKSRDHIFIAHDVYLDDRFLDDYIVGDDELLRLKETLWQHKDAQNLFYLGNAFRYSKNQYEALDCYRKSVEIHPDFAETHVNLGGCLSELKRDDEAEKEYREALRIKPNFAEVHYNLGNLFKELKRYEESESEYKEALRIKPEIAEAHTNLGLLLVELERHEEAEEEYREALRINPDLAEAHTNLGILLGELKRHEEAEKEYKEALRINSDPVEPHFNLGNLLFQLKRYEEAEKELTECLRINPKDSEAHTNLGAVLTELKRYEPAEKEYREAIQINPDAALAHLNLAHLLEESKRYDEASKEYKEASRIDSSMTNANTSLAILLCRLKKFKEAEEEFKKVLRINPSDTKAHYNLGLLLYELKRYEEAEKHYEVALRIDPYLAEGRANLGLCLINLNRKHEARKQLAIACDLFRKQGHDQEAKRFARLLEEL